MKVQGVRFLKQIRFSDKSGFPFRCCHFLRSCDPRPLVHNLIFDMDTGSDFHIGKNDAVLHDSALSNLDAAPKDTVLDITLDF